MAAATALTSSFSSLHVSHGISTELFCNISTNRCTKKFFCSPSKPLVGIVNSFLQMGHGILTPDRMPFFVLLRLKQIRQNVWKQGRTLGSLNASPHMLQCVIVLSSSRTAETTDCDAAIFSSAVSESVATSAFTFGYKFSGPKHRSGIFQTASNAN